MAGAQRQPDGDDWSAAAEHGAPADTDAAELIAQIRQLAADADPAGVRQVVAEVLSALDRAAGGALREQLPKGLPGATGYDGPAGSAPDQAGGDADLAGRAEPPVDLPDGYENAPVDLPAGAEDAESTSSADQDGPPANRLTGQDEPPVTLSDLEAAGSEERPTGSG
ncbi:hypothetical protein [Micromonospora sp. NBC_01796]|uniref:hypothetical protein n=1 Tax=Micromonospora sp. NBC_01796 TaxID=2975987 RepID=UPI002DD857A7|nr:hypothetical protein [Micromonospora sp. NBC_01796]WSA88140.1 hypothetical protein OIE47_11285 [Micromonospora sp. NBC_01796]